MGGSMDYLTEALQMATGGQWADASLVTEDQRSKAKRLLKRFRNDESDVGRGARAYLRAVASGRDAAYLLDAKGAEGKGARKAAKALKEDLSEVKGAVSYADALKEIEKIARMKGGSTPELVELVRWIRKTAKREHDQDVSHAAMLALQDLKQSRVGSLKRALSTLRGAIQEAVSDWRKGIKDPSSPVNKKMLANAKKRAAKFRKPVYIYFDKAMGRLMFTPARHPGTVATVTPDGKLVETVEGLSEGMSSALRAKVYGFEQKMRDMGASAAVFTGRELSTAWPSKALAAKAAKMMKKAGMRVDPVERSSAGFHVSGHVMLESLLEFEAADLDKWWAESRPKLIKGGKATRERRMNGCIRSLRALRDGGVAVSGQSRTELNPVPKKERDSEDQPVDKTPGKVANEAKIRFDAPFRDPMRSMAFVEEGFSPEKFGKRMALNLLRGPLKGKFPSDKIIWLSSVAAAFVKKNEAKIRKQIDNGTLDSKKLMQAFKQYALNAAKKQQEDANPPTETFGRLDRVGASILRTTRRIP
jgi:hypothetical protein